MGTGDDGSDQTRCPEPPSTVTLPFGRFRPDFVQSRSAAVKLLGDLYQILASPNLHAGRSFGSLSDVVTVALGRAKAGIAMVPLALPILNCLRHSAAGLSHRAGGAE
jgi:hypothetical protein